MLTHDRQIIIATAGSRRATQWPSSTLFWSEMVEKLRTPIRGTETLAEYMALTKSRQDELKDVGGFVAGSFTGNRRKPEAVLGRDLLTLDLDNIQPGGTADTLRRLDGLGCGYAVYSTRKHSEAKPRLRVLVPLNRTSTADEYEPLARKLGAIIGIELCDPTTFQVSRLMYWPSCCADSQYIYVYGDRPFLDADGLLATYADWRNVASWPEVPGTQQTHQRLAAKQGDPTQKQGIVGAFCKNYDIIQAMEAFLPGTYAPCDIGPDRYTFTGGSTAGGAVVYDNGAFLYSHHATDPAGGRLVNSFDLVRLHLFADKDDDAKPETPTNKLPSFTAMCERAVADAQVATLLNQERYEKATADFGNPLVVNDIDWMKRLTISGATGAIAKTAKNVMIILENDPLFKGKIAFDEFANRGVVMGPLPWNAFTGRRDWADNDDKELRIHLEYVYGLACPSKVEDALGACVYKNRFNDVQSYLTRLVWDGIPRLDTLLIDYLGATDSTYTREVTRKALVAAVARAMTPGVKFDNVLILVGPQDIGKSTFLRILGRNWFSDSLTSFEGKEAAEMIQGVWINELGELSSFNRSETNVIKQFLSRTEDIYREPFGKRTNRYPRRCVFFGTTNEGEFLKDVTGNRRFWPVELMERQPTKNVFYDLPNELDRVWAEAFTLWQSGEPLFLPLEIKALANEQQELHRESSAKEGLILEFMERPVPLDWQRRSLNERRLYWSGEFGRVEGETVPRDRICAVEVWCECFNGDSRYIKRSDTAEINGILGRLQGWKRQNSALRCGPYGPQKGFVRLYF